MHAACGGERDKEKLGTPQTPAGGLRPPAPPAQCLFSVSQFCANGEIILRRVRAGHHRSFIGYNVDVAVIAAGKSLFKEVEL